MLGFKDNIKLCFGLQIKEIEENIFNQKFTHFLHVISHLFCE